MPKSTKKNTRRLCLYFRRYLLIFKDPIESKNRVPTSAVDRVTCSSCPLYSFTFIDTQPAKALLAQMALVILAEITNQMDR